MKQSRRKHSPSFKAKVALEALKDEETRRTLDKSIGVNLRSAINCTKAVLPHMIEQGGGRVVNIGSEAGRTGDPERAVYSACKGAVIALTKAIARDVGYHGVTVNCVCPHRITPQNLEQEAGEGSVFHPENGQYKMMAPHRADPQR